MIRKGRGGDIVEKQMLLIMGMIGGLLLLIACAVKGEMEGLLDGILRGLIGSVGIHLCNFGLGIWGISVGIGINAVTFLTCAILGIPGFLGLYALGFYHLL